MTRKEMIEALQAKGITHIWGKGLWSRTKEEINEYLMATSNNAHGFARHTSYSAINDYRKCGMLYYFKKVDPNAPKSFPSSPSMFLGTCYHEAVAAGLEDKKGNNIDPSPSLVEDAFARVWKERQDEVAWTDEDRDGMLRQGIALVELYRSTSVPTLSPLAVEETQDITFGNKEYQLRVISDLEAYEEDESVGAGIIVADHKTASKSPAFGEADTSEQLTVEALAYKVKTGGMPEHVRLDKAIRYKTQPKNPEKFRAIKETPYGTVAIMPMVSTRTEEDIRRYLKIMDISIQGIQRQQWTPATPGMAWWCGPEACEYWGYCHEQLI